MKKYLLLFSTLFISACVTPNQEVVETSPVNFSYNYTASFEKEDGTVLFKKSGSVVNKRVEEFSFVKKNSPDYSQSTIVMTSWKENSQDLYMHLTQFHKFNVTNIVHVKNEMADLHIPENTTVEIHNRLLLKPHQTSITQFKSPYPNDINKNYILKLTVN